MNTHIKLQKSSPFLSRMHVGYCIYLQSIWYRYSTSYTITYNDREWYKLKGKRRMAIKNWAGLGYMVYFIARTSYHSM